MHSSEYIKLRNDNFINMLNQKVDGDFILEEDIALTKDSDIPITHFSGAIDCQNHKIILQKLPLFGTFSGFIKNVVFVIDSDDVLTDSIIHTLRNGRIEDCIVTASDKKIRLSICSNISGLLAKTVTASSIKNTKLISCNIEVDWETDVFGGIVGSLSTDSLFSNCSVEDCVISAAKLVGGLIGYNYGIIEKCKVTNVLIMSENGSAGSIAYVNAHIISDCFIRSIIQSKKNSGVITHISTNLSSISDIIAFSIVKSSNSSILSSSHFHGIFKNIKILAFCLSDSNTNVIGVSQFGSSILENVRGYVLANFNTIDLSHVAIKNVNIQCYSLKTDTIAEIS